jgi:hypothetical protein
MIYVSEGREGNPPLFGQQSCEKQFLGVKAVIVKEVVDCTRVFDDLEVLPALKRITNTNSRRNLHTLEERSGHCEKNSSAPD